MLAIHFVCFKHSPDILFAHKLIQIEGFFAQVEDAFLYSLGP